MRYSDLNCGSGSAWVDNKQRFFKKARRISRGKLKGWYEIEVPTACGGFRKIKVAEDDIIYLPSWMRWLED